MSQWHREHPELAGTDADPWMQHEGYRKAAGYESTPEQIEDARLEEIDESALPRATRRCWDCGVATGPCQCTPEFEAYEAEIERREA